MKPLQLFFFISILIFMSCSSDDDTAIEQPIVQPPLEVEEPIQYLALGDSYTIGQGVEESERWPNQLVEELRSNDKQVDRVEIIAQSGWRTNNLIDAIASNNPQGFNLVSLLIGVNNQFSNLDFDIFIAEFNELLQTSINIAGSSERVFVVSIPDYGVTPFGSSWGNPSQIASELDMYNAYMHQRCEELGIPFINITDISRSLGSSQGALSDGLHPSGMQYALWVDEMLPVVLELVNHE